MTRNTASLDVTWHKSTFLLPLYCLCVLLASTGSLTVALATALLMMIAALLSSMLVVLVAGLGVGLSVGIAGTALWLLLAGAVTALLELAMHAWFYELHKELGMFLPMIAIGSILLARQEMQAQITRLAPAIARALLMSAGYALAAIVLGAGRELVGHGSLFNKAGALWGAWAAPLEMQLFPADMGFLLGVLAPGAFIALGLGVALYNWLWLRLIKLKLEKP